MNDLWGEVRLAVEAARMNHERIARVVWLLWEYREEGDEWEALRDYAVRALEGCEVGSVALSDVVVWMCAEGEQCWEEEHDGIVLTVHGKPSAWFRAGWAWCVLQGRAESPHLHEGEWVSWDVGWSSKWAVENQMSGSPLPRKAEGKSRGEAWPDHLDTRPLKRAA